MGSGLLGSGSGSDSSLNLLLPQRLYAQRLELPLDVVRVDIGYEVFEPATAIVICLIPASASTATGRGSSTAIIFILIAITADHTLDDVS
jgi:hypothetical protein